MTTYRLASKPRQSFGTIGQAIDYLLNTTQGAVEGHIEIEHNYDGQSRGRLKYVLQDDFVLVRPTTKA